MACHFKGNEAGFGTRNRISAEDFIGQHRETVDADRFETQIKRASLARGFDPRFDKSEIFLEDAVLQCNRKCENTIEPALDGGKVVAQTAIGILELETGSLNEVPETDRLELSVAKKVEPA